MNTGVTVSKTQKHLSTIVTATGSVMIIGLALAFMSIDFGNIPKSSSYYTGNVNAVSALKPIRSDAPSEPNNGNDGNSDNNNGFLPIDDSLDDLNGDYNDNDYPDHGLPCLDPNCPVHHESNVVNDGSQNDNAVGSEHIKCDDPNCLICNNLPPVDISMNVIQFKADSREYVNETAALATLEQYIDSFDVYFERYPEGKIYLVGTIAKTSSFAIIDTELSEQRANTVRNSFIQLGVDADKLIAIGIGANDPWRVDEWTDGYFDEALAKINRRVWIIPDQYDKQVNIVFSVSDMIDEERGS